ncbi:MAG TPA: metalloregulator ArsR/SmtB family transcription factor [Bacillota bacterium]
MYSHREIESFLKAIGEETRLRMIAYLTIDTFCVCEFVELLQMSQPSISQHLRRLKEAELIKEERRGKWVFYSLDRTHPMYPLLLHVVNMLPPLEENVQSFIVDGKRILCE